MSDRLPTRTIAIAFTIVEFEDIHLLTSMLVRAVQAHARDMATAARRGAGDGSGSYQIGHHSISLRWRAEASDLEAVNGHGRAIEDMAGEVRREHPGVDP